MVRIGRILQALVLELVEQERHPLEAVAAVAVAAVGEKADHRLVDLHPPRRLRPVGRDRALRSLRRDRSRPIRDQQADEDLQRQRLLGGRLLAGHREEAEVGHRPLPEALLARHAVERARLVVLAGDRRPDHHPVEPQVPGQRLRGQPGDPLAHQRPPGDRRGDGARIASRDSRPPSPFRYFRNADLPPRASIAASIASGRGSSASASVARNSARVSGASAICEESKLSSRASFSPECAKRSISARVRRAPARPGEAR